MIGIVGDSDGGGSENRKEVEQTPGRGLLVCGEQA